MSLSSRWFVGVLVLPALFPWGCSERGSGAETHRKTVATVGDRKITTDDFLSRLTEQPEVVRIRYAPLARRKELLDAMIRQELLLQEARRQHLDQDPAVKGLMEKMMVQQLIQKQVPAAPSEAEARAYFDAHLSEFNRLERIRVSHLLLSKKDSSRAEVSRVLARFRSLQEPALSSAFADAVRQSSVDTASKSSDGDLGLRTRDELAALWGPDVADAAFALKIIGEVSAPLEDEKGTHLLKLSGRQPGLTTPFDDARARISNRLTAEARSKSLDSLVSSLKTQVKVEVDEKVLSDLNVDAGGVPPSTPDAG